MDGEPSGPALLYDEGSDRKPMSVDWKSFTLPDRIETIAESELHAFLLANQTAPVRLSAASLRRIDTRMLQYLIIVAQDWALRNIAFVVCDVKAPQAAMLTLIGVTQALLPWQEVGA